MHLAYRRCCARSGQPGAPPFFLRQSVGPDRLTEETATRAGGRGLRRSADEPMNLAVWGEGSGGAHGRTYPANPKSRRRVRRSPRFALRALLLLRTVRSTVPATLRDAAAWAFLNSAGPLFHLSWTFFVLFFLIFLPPLPPSLDPAAGAGETIRPCAREDSRTGQPARRLAGRWGTGWAGSDRE